MKSRSGWLLWIILIPVCPLAQAGLGLKDFIGPFDSWADVKRDYGAVGDGQADDTAALQKALDELGPENRKSAVMFLPSGTYRITQTLRLPRPTHESAKDIAIFGYHANSAILLWDGPADGTMFDFNAWYSQLGRITMNGQNKAAYALRHGPAFTTYNEIADMRFCNVGIGIEAGVRDGIAETAVIRCLFYNCSKAGISITNFNSLDWFIWASWFQKCRLGITNAFGAGNFYAYRNFFDGNTDADISIGNTGYFSFRENGSMNSKSFFVAGGIGAAANLTIDSNRIVGLKNTPLQIGNLGPVLLMDNGINCFKCPVARINPNAGLVSIGNTFTCPEPITAKPKPIQIDEQVVPIITDYSKVPVNDFIPTRPNPAIEVTPKDTADAIQKAIDKAAGLDAKNAIVHFSMGQYAIDKTLVIPGNKPIRLIGDGSDTVLSWRGQEGLPVIRFEGPSRAIVENLFINGSGKGDGIVIANCDQPGSRVLMDQPNVSTCKEVGYLVDGLDNTEVALCNINHGDCDIGVKIVGGPLAREGKESKGTTTIFSGASSNNRISYTLADGGALVVRDIWYESGNQPGFLDLSGKGRFTLNGAMVATAIKDNIPAIDIHDFDGQVTLLTSIFHSGCKAVPIRIRGLSEQSNILFLGSQFGMGDFAPVVEGDKGKVVVAECVRFTQGGGAEPVADIGTADPELIKQMLSDTRNRRVPGDQTVDPDVTNFVLHRVMVSNTRTGIRLSK